MTLSNGWLALALVLSLALGFVLGAIWCGLAHEDDPTDGARGGGS